MKTLPTPRRQIYDLYWYFAAERQKIFERRTLGQPSPWTDDVILQHFKFCNVFRASDRVSQYMIKSICYHNEPCSNNDRLFQIVSFRLFSKIETWVAVHEYLGRFPLLNDLADGSFTKALEHAIAKNGRIYTNAFILCANNAYGQPKKYLNHAELLRDMFLNNNLGQRLQEAPSLQAIFELIIRYPLMGNFMSYQIAIDLNYSSIIDFNENDFTIAGPGALRGLQKVFVNLGDYSPAEAIRWMVRNQEQEFSKLGLEFNGLFGRALHAVDAQGLFCEVDKYCREAAPELASTRTRIKTKFKQTQKPLELFFPPKWNINVNILKPVS